ncbi:AAA family ATPase [Desulfobaculum sp. SPO524]|uniref:AAA family ATPase n=1 Tax=Desulfobaculum sp. SPO524 TaxID=3378071 RepID=UPI0038552C63
MNNLENYLNGEYKVVDDERRRVRKTCEEVFRSLMNACENDQECKDSYAWPYEVGVEDGTEGHSNNKAPFSISTNSMILYSILEYKRPKDSDYKDLIQKLKGVYKNIYQTVTEGDDDKSKCKACSKEDTKKEPSKTCFCVWPDFAPCKGEDNGKAKVHSNTYGLDDPLSLFWLFALSHDFDTLKIDIGDVHSSEIEEYVLKVLHERLVGVDGSGKECKNLELDSRSKCQQKYKNDHAFIVLWIARLLRLYKREKGEDSTFSDAYGKIFEFCERVLHQQLSFYNIPDSRFDPAELAFSLEGMLLCDKKRVSREVQERVFDVLKGYQSASPYWRPVKPIYSTKGGEVLLPLSVEVVSSLLATCEIVDEDTQHDSFFVKYVDLFKRYKKWLMAQYCTVESKKGSFEGWTSEHAPHDGAIHLWQTSQIFGFLDRYQSMLSKMIARTALEYSGLDVVSTKDMQDKEEEKDDSKPKGWQKEILGDALCSLVENSDWRITSVIYDDYIAPREDATPRCVQGKSAASSLCSFLLYGPPGTGKTRFSKELAKELGYQFITVTPSDFLAGGAAEVEQRAKAIFQMLEQQDESVVLFDEIDHFLLDRQSEEYKGQTGIFQFMTPGMLPKLQRLRDSGKVIFIVATNFAERIDSAIKRQGRIDEHLLLLPPCRMRRESILNELLMDRGVSLDGIDLGDALDNTTLWTFGELAKAVQSLKNFNPTDIENDLRAYTEDNSSSIQLGNYRSRFFEGKEIKESVKQTPWVEYFWLYLLKNEQANNELRSYHNLKLKEIEDSYKHVVSGCNGDRHDSKDTKNVSECSDEVVAGESKDTKGVSKDFDDVVGEVIKKCLGQKV